VPAEKFRIVDAIGGSHWGSNGMGVKGKGKLSSGGRPTVIIGDKSGGHRAPTSGKKKVRRDQCTEVAKKSENVEKIAWEGESKHGRK